MINLDKKTSDGLIDLCSISGCGLRDIAALLWGLVLQIYAHSESISFQRELPGQAPQTIEFSTSKEPATALSALAALHTQASPLPEGFSFSDESYLGMFDGYGQPDHAYFSLEGGSFCISLEHLADDELNPLPSLLMTLSEEIAAHPDRPLDSLRRVSPEDEERILALSKGEDMPYDEDKTWLALFRERVALSPDSPAVFAPNGRLTYRELDDASDRVASYILNTGTECGSFIALMTGRVKEYVTGILGIHKAGCAYVPIDISYNKNRIDYMLEDSEAPLILDENTIIKALDSERVPLPEVSPDNRAYMIYTSGSTGSPKGAVISHKALMNFTLAIIRQNGITEKDRIAAHRSFSFDAHIEDFFPTLSAGASVFIMPESIRKNPDLIASFLDENRITGCGFTTSLAKLLITGRRLNVRYITCGGEALSGVTSSNVQLINKYGPTEFTNDITGYKLKSGTSYNVVPIGRPLPNNNCFVMDPFMNLLPEGAPGELCLAGAQAGLGYYRRPEMTKEVFVESPYFPGGLIYRTGDIARYLKDGNIAYIGRMDDQVKLNGYRIELGEIESFCGGFEGVKEAAALIKDIRGTKHLVLYFTAKEKAVVDEQRLRSHMESGFLPEYMYPEIYIKLEDMPRLPNGKIDRRHMPEPEFIIETENVNPRTALETHILNAAKQVLPGASFGITDDLFALGLTSLGAMKFIALINRLDYPTKYSVGDIMRYRTVEGLIEGNRRVCYRYNAGFDPSKPVLVFIYGIAPVSGTIKMLDLWSTVFNIFVIEPIDSHFEALFDSPDYQEIEALYLDILDIQVPGGSQSIDGLMGFSWGGFVSYTLAAAIGKKGKKPFVILGDTDFNECTENSKPARDPDLLPENLLELTNGALTKAEALIRFNLVYSINRTVKTIPVYDGPVTMLDAAAYTDEEGKDIHKKKLDILKDHAKNLHIVEFPHHGHDDLFYDASLAPVYLNEMRNINPF